MSSREKLLGNRKEGLVFVVSAPAGTGKTTLVNMLVKEFPSVVESISYTTRPARAGEVHGVHYNFVSVAEFEQKIANSGFLEYVKLYGNYYGTALHSVQELIAQGKHVILVIDTQGALQLKGKFPATFIFLKPPSLEVLRERLLRRQTETAVVIDERLLWAQKEIALAGKYDYCIVNDELQIAYEALRSIIIAEEHKVLNH